MREILLRCSLIGVYALVRLLSADVQADPWHSEKGLASYYGEKAVHQVHEEESQQANDKK